MNDCLSYVLFQGDHPNSFDFNTYMRGFHLNVRMAQLLYPGYSIALTVDISTMADRQSGYFQELSRDGHIDLSIVGSQLLCRMMLERLNPLFTNQYERVLCRDTDSLLSYRERMAVQYWTTKNSVAHAITDSISHNLTFLGGMCGFKSTDIKLLFNANTLKELVHGTPNQPYIDYSRKGSDQDFLNRVILPRVADSLTEHYVKGMPNSFRADYHDRIEEIGLGLPDYLRETDNLGWHIGASGFQVDATVKFLQKYGVMNDYWDSLEKQFPNIFYWQL